MGKVAIIRKKIDEFLSLIKTENNIFSHVQNVFRSISDIIKHLDDLPKYAQKANDFADRITHFGANAKRWKAEFGKLNIRRQFKLDFDRRLQNLCDKFHSFVDDNAKEIQRDNFFKIIREFVTKETDSLISQSVERLNRLKIPLEEARNHLKRFSISVEEIEAVGLGMQSFSGHFFPVLQAIRQLPNCSRIHFIFEDINTRCGKEVISFGKKDYNEYNAAKSEIKAFIELLPDEWESLSLQKCIAGGTCLSFALKRQAQSVANNMEKLKKKFNDFEFLDKLKQCKASVEEVSDMFKKVENISRLVKEFSYKEDIIKMKDLSRRITGKVSENDMEHGSQVSLIFLFLPHAKMNI
jgi:hypothetical protein